MAVTGLGTEENPFIVHNYEEFISLSAHVPIGDTHAVYIQFFDDGHPNQVIDCNTYGSEFRWGAFIPIVGYGAINYNINLNGCTIKNFMMADGTTMFTGDNGGSSYNPGMKKIIISNGFIRNIFIGSATSKICGDCVEFHNVSLSVNFSGATVTPFNGNGNLTIDNCAMYLVGSTLQAPIMTNGIVSDSDIELHISNQNGICMFNGGGAYGYYSTLNGCRIQGKISGTPISHAETGKCSVFGCASPYNSGDSAKQCKLINCVVDVDLTDSFFDYHGATYYIYKASGSTDMNTNVLCKSHYPTVSSYGYSYPSDWNYMDHEGLQSIRYGPYLNDEGFVCAIVVGG